MTAFDLIKELHEMLESHEPGDDEISEGEAAIELLDQFRIMLDDYLEIER